MEYKILEENSIYKLTQEVNKHLKDGWKLVGSHLITIIGHSSIREDNIIVSQTIVKDFTDVSGQVIPSSPNLIKENQA